MKVMIVFGTRPEAIKLVSVIKEFEKYPNIETIVCSTGQHKAMLDQVLSLFKINVKYDLDIMGSSTGLSSITSNILLKLEPILIAEKPDIILVHGDTATTLAASLAAFYQQIPIGHVEAGLRTGNLLSPWPEEGNRKIVSAIANLHFAPTVSSKNNLLKESIIDENIYVTGNTVIDSLLLAKTYISSSDVSQKLQEEFKFLEKYEKIILITGHRRENFGFSFRNICEAIRILSEEFPNIGFVYPVHLNPNIRQPAISILGGKDNIYLIEPLSYDSFIFLMDKSYLILTDSGGIQEEAPSLGKPVLVMRDTTERPEAIEAGTVLLVGTESASIIENTKTLLFDTELYNRMSEAHNPYGDGAAAQRICKIIQERI